MPNWSFIRRLISGSGNIFARSILRLPVRDCTGGFRCYRRQVLESIDLDTVQSHGYAFQVEMTYRVLNKGFTVVETPITFVDRRLGQSKMSRSIVLEAFIYVLKTRASKVSVPKSQPKVRYVHRIMPPPPLPQRVENQWPPYAEKAADPKPEDVGAVTNAQRKNTFAIPPRPTRHP
ncbi:hypothetical protein [Dictyobacter kobayashii]|uniref:Glycosyltransferase 2-like domain-containing protein n=1 Tax=Dictyobacter kobayashii TaxID=2014872 RepID=A0A402AWL3_9CHLR|nr:hypothetical protein [Dictyobacter kobayashii]GCE23540.1 hypothetical protein KDK_73400 [Dictyobacter kobayashii]